MHKSVSQNSASEMLYPSIGPFDQRVITVPGGHQIYMEQCGNPRGVPVVVLHGGPGGGCSPAMRRFFDPEVYRVVLFDQRGCGRSKPTASVTNNTTWDLVADIELIRETLKIDKWMVFGGSWGATLSLIYAQAHPDHVMHLILRGVFLMTKPELDWFYGGGAADFWPDEWARFTHLIPKEERGDMIAAYHKRLFGDNIDEQVLFARAWASWESSLAVLDPGEHRGVSPAEYARAFSRLENHYFINNGFLSEDQAILKNMNKIEHIPGVIVQGRYDMICPPARAHALAQLWPAGKLEIVPTAGHALSEPGVTAKLVAAMDALRD
ncbi:MAG: prolyl aminopeptidase [Proteobacteria bacterium]|jgi:proline iminopeptidase|nr:prolyl aminopeptidase [Pseudomonadota bacterium]